jgi:hypothetical protein
MGDFKVTAFKMDSSGMKQMLNEQFVRDDLTDRAERVRDAAASGDPNYDYQIVQGTTDRVKVSVGSDDEGVLFAESATGNLVRALDAGAGSS